MKLKTGADPVLDNGVRDIDLFMYLNGEIVEAYGVTKTFDKVKVHRDEKDQIVEQVGNTIEDGGFAILKFANGAVCNWTPAYWGGHGEASNFGRWIYGSRGCIKGEELIPDTGPRMNVSTRFLLETEPKLRNKFFPKGITDTFALEIYDFRRMGRPEGRSRVLRGHRILMAQRTRQSKRHLGWPNRRISKGNQRKPKPINMEIF